MAKKRKRSKKAKRESQNDIHPRTTIVSRLSVGCSSSGKHKLDICQHDGLAVETSDSIKINVARSK